VSEGLAPRQGRVMVGGWDLLEGRRIERKKLLDGRVFVDKSGFVCKQTTKSWTKSYPCRCLHSSANGYNTERKEARPELYYNFDLCYCCN
jgi:hypothetical protein